MKKIILFTLFLFSIGLKQADAQVSVNINIGSPPTWAPYGYEERYYYLPDIDTYYDVHSSKFIYCSGGRWVFASTLPHIYANFDLYHGYKVAIDYEGPDPYRYYSVHRVRYPRGYYGPRQITVREYHSHEDRYRNIPPGHWKNGKWRDEVAQERYHERERWDDDRDDDHGDKHDHGHGHGHGHH